MKKLSMIVIIAFNLIGTNMHALETRITEHTIHDHIDQCLNLSHGHEHIHSHNNSTHQHSHNHGKSHTNVFDFLLNELKYSLSTIRSEQSQFLFQKLQLPNPQLEGLFRPPKVYFSF